LWKDGELVLVKTYERLAYFGADSSPSGISSVPALAKIVRDPRLVETSVRAIRALGSQISGAFDIDLRDDDLGVAQITEINAGRLISGTNLFDLSGRHNMASTYIRLALDELVKLGDPYEVADDYYMVRDLDTVPGIYHADDLFADIEDARGKTTLHVVPMTDFQGGR
jgi:carbamoyl-phosphate synthase large subunit